MRQRINFLIILFTISLSLISCTKDFLNVPIQGQESPSLDPTIALDLVTGAYNSLITPDATEASGFGGYDIHGIMFITVTNIISDDADKGSFASDQPDCEAIDNFTVTSSNSYLDPLWKGYYAGISRTNQAIAALAIAALPDTVIKVRTAEMRFIRAYYYFNLVRMFGGVPIVLNVPSGPRDNDSSFFTRASDSDCL
ncbi:MAG: RagB/SusD family nutrient uptake outer membrane protein [Ferruginibacter sp.]